MAIRIKARGGESAEQMLEAFQEALREGRADQGRQEASVLREAPPSAADARPASVRPGLPRRSLACDPLIASARRLHLADEASIPQRAGPPMTGAQSDSDRIDGRALFHAPTSPSGPARSKTWFRSPAEIGNESSPHHPRPPAKSRVIGDDAVPRTPIRQPLPRLLPSS